MARIVLGLDPKDGKPIAVSIDLKTKMLAESGVACAERRGRRWRGNSRDSGRNGGARNHTR